MVAREVRFWMKEKVEEGVLIARVAREYGVSVHVRIQQLALGQPFEVLHGAGVVASHQLIQRGPVTLPEHACAIRERAGRRPSTKPKARYEQRLDPAPFGLPLAPLVQTPSLSHYERLAEAS